MAVEEDGNLEHEEQLDMSGRSMARIMQALVDVTIDAQNNLRDSSPKTTLPEIRPPNVFEENKLRDFAEDFQDQTEDSQNASPVVPDIEIVNQIPFEHLRDPFEGLPEPDLETLPPLPDLEIPETPEDVPLPEIADPLPVSEEGLVLPIEDIPAEELILPVTPQQVLSDDFDLSLPEPIRPEPLLAQVPEQEPLPEEPKLEVGQPPVDELPIQPIPELPQQPELDPALEINGPEPLLDIDVPDLAFADTFVPPELGIDNGTAPPSLPPLPDLTITPPPPIGVQQDLRSGGITIDDPYGVYGEIEDEIDYVTRSDSVLEEMSHASDDLQEAEKLRWHSLMEWQRTQTEFALRERFVIDDQSTQMEAARSY